MVLSNAGFGADGLVPMGNQRRDKSFQEAQDRLVALALKYSVWDLLPMKANLNPKEKRYADMGLSEPTTYVCNTPIWM